MVNGKRVSKADVCDALFSFNRAVETIFESLLVMQSAGIDFPFLNGHRIVISEMQRALNSGVALRYFPDWPDLPKMRTRNGVM